MSTKKVLAVIMALVMLVCCMSVTALADDPVEGEEKYVAYIPVEGEETMKFTSLAAALKAVEEYTDITIYLAGNDELTDNMIIPAGITVIIATSENYEADNTTKGNNISGGVNPKDAFATLTIPSEFTLTVNGTLIVAGNQQGSNPRTGFLTGDYGAVDVEGGLIVNGSLYARGDVYTKTTGKVTANENAKVYQRLEISDWRGGTAASIAYLAKIFPFNLYELSGISTELICNNGTTLYAQAFIYASDQGISVNVPYLASNGDGMIRFSGTGGDVRFTKANDITNITINANLETGNLSFEEDVDGESYPIDSSGLVCPFGYHTNLLINKGSSVTVKTLLKFLPGCQVTVEEGASLAIGEIIENEDGTKTTTEGAAYFYTAADYSNTFNWAKWPAADVTVDDAVLKAPVDAVKLAAGKIGSSSAEHKNLPEGFTLIEGTAGTAPVTEFIQRSPVYLSSTQNVTFYLVTP